MKVVILCGGKGVRAYPFTDYLPKPMLPVNGSPILVHIIKSFVAQGYREFVLAAGYRKNAIAILEHKTWGPRTTSSKTAAERTGGRIAAAVISWASLHRDLRRRPFESR